MIKNIIKIPIKPREPKKPSKFLCNKLHIPIGKHRENFTDYGNSASINISKILDAMEKLKSEAKVSEEELIEFAVVKIYISNDDDDYDYDKYVHASLTVDDCVNNENYDKEMEKYNKDMEKYNKDMEEFSKQLTEYEKKMLELAEKKKKDYEANIDGEVQKHINALKDLLGR